MIYSVNTSSAIRKKIPLILRMIGIDHQQEPINRPKGISVYQWFYCSEGKGELILSGEKRIIESGMGFFINSRESHSYKGLTNNFTLHFLGFEGSICNVLLQTIKLSESGVYHLASPDSFCKSLANIYWMTQRNISQKDYLLSEMLYSLLLQLSMNISKINETTPVDTNPIVEEIMLILEEHYADNISITDISERLGKSPEYLCSVFKKNMRSTIIAELTKIRIIRAQHLLIDYPSKSAAEIGLMCGFQSPSYFGKIFKKISGIAPNKYRMSKITD